MKVLKPRGEQDKTEKANDSAFTVVMFGLLWVVIYFLFYGAIWAWASSNPVASLLDKQGVISAFESKFEKADALAELTTCLDRSVPSGKVAISDVVLCLKVMGMESQSAM